MIDTDPASAFATPRVAAGALFTDADQRVLMLRTTYKSFWDIPGGYVEIGESPLDACVREVREELGLDIRITELLVVDWAPHPDEGDKILFIFDGGHLSEEQLTQITFTDGEIAEWAFVGAPGLAEVTISRLSGRIQQALEALELGRTLYLQEGRIPHS